jgi:hypothetical protein
MQLRRLGRPSASMVVAVAALVAATAGTAVAVTAAVNGDTLIKKGTLSGNRLRNDSVTGKQIKESKLGTVPSAKVAATAGSATTAGTATNATHATNATSATSATSATNATNATTAANALALGGLAPGSFQGGLMYAVFNPDGTIVAQSGGISLAGGFTGTTGAYVEFPKALKAVMVSDAYTAADQVGQGAPKAEICGGATGLVGCGVGSNTTSEAFVRTFNSDGATALPHAFTIIGIP